jgi:hypothetical protein
MHVLDWCAERLRRNCIPQGAIAALLALLSIPCYAQLSSASVNGTIRDQKGAVIPGATVLLHNVDTNVDRQVESNGSGAYAILNLVPGKYTLAARAAGFNPQQISQFVLAVDQIATFDFTLAVGGTTEVVNVEAAAAQLDVTSANLGTVIETKQVNDLPLDGRNFTSLLQLTPGVVPIMTGQNAGMNGSGGGFGAPVAIGADYAFPAINGQTNRSDYFLMDGLNNYGTLESTYAVPPIIDAIQEFKIVSHTDNAEYGSVLGGVVNVVTKSGTNQYHGSAWEYLRNNVFDAVNYFHNPSVPAPSFHQNQFGASIGGPLVIPKLYNGHNKTFLFGAYQGWRYSRPNDTNLLVPTDAELAGNEADNGQLQIYNPYQTVASGDTFTRPAFAGNQIPSNLIDPRMVAYAQFVFPKAGPFFGTPSAAGVFPFNAVDSTPLVQHQNEFNIRGDQNFGQKDSAWFRYSWINEEVTSSAGLPTVPSDHIIQARDWGGSYVHIFSSTKIVQAQYARTTVLDNTFNRFTADTADIYKTVGFADSFANGFAGANGGFLIPNPSINGLSNAGESIDLTPRATDSHEARGNYTQIIGNHEVKFGAGYIWTGFASPLSQISLGFGSTQTGDPQNAGATGDPVSSFLLNVPNGANRRNVNETERPGGLLSTFLQDSWKATPRLTVNYGLRYDYPFIPPYGTTATIGEQGGIETGDMDFANGTYILQYLPPPCTVRGHAPCIPGDGTLPDHVVELPFHHIAHNEHTNWGPRFGFAFKVNDKTVAHGAFGIVFDDWAAVTQMAQNIEGSWPDIGQQIAPSTTNYPTTENPTPTVNAQNPFGSGSSSLFPPPTPFGSNQWFYDPNIKNPYSEQWNFGIQRQVTGSMALRVDYVGSGSHRTNVGGLYNTALTPGPGDTQPRALYPYSIPTFYDRSIGTSSYNAMQVQLDKRYSSGFSYQVAYTWSKALSEDDGWFGVEWQTVQDPYHPSASYGLAGTNLPNVFSANGLYQIPVGPGKQFSTGNKVLDYIVGNWQLNNIFTWRDGQDFTATDSNDRANIGGGGQRADQIGDPHLSHRNAAEWFNTAAFALPPLYTFGNAGRNTLRAQRYITLDTSIIRAFPFWREGVFEFRAEAFNIFNHPVFGIPNNDVFSPSFGTVTGTADNPRQMQFSGKIVF